MEQTIVNKIKEILLEDQEIKDSWDDLTHISSLQDALKTPKLLYFFIQKLVYVIELIQAEFHSITKEERIEYAAQVLDDLISFSGWFFWLEALDYQIFKLIVSQIVVAIDEKFGSGSWFIKDSARVSIDPVTVLEDATKKKFAV